MYPGPVLPPQCHLMPEIWTQARAASSCSSSGCQDGCLCCPKGGRGRCARTEGWKGEVREGGGNEETLVTSNYYLVAETKESNSLEKGEVSGTKRLRGGFQANDQGTQGPWDLAAGRGLPWLPNLKKPIMFTLPTTCPHILFLQCTDIYLLIWLFLCYLSFPLAG